MLALARCVRAVHANRLLGLGFEDVSELAGQGTVHGQAMCIDFGRNTAVFQESRYVGLLRGQRDSRYRVRVTELVNARQVKRAVRRREDRSMEMEVCLSPYEGPEVHQQFLVVKNIGGGLMKSGSL